MSSKHVAFGSLRVAYNGQTELLCGTVTETFATGATEVDFSVELRQGMLPPPPVGAELLQQTTDDVVYRSKDGWQRRFLARYQGRCWEYACVDYTDRSAVLTVAPDCSNVPHCVDSCTAFEHLALWADALPLHASHIQLDGSAILFTAPCGVGKSTQAALWQHHRGARIINGDKALLLCKNSPVYASGLPYSGTSGICENAAAPLKAIVVLEQGKENVLTRLQGGKAVIRLMTGVICQSWHEGDREQALSLAIRVAQQVPVFLLSCLPDESAVICLENALQKLREGESL